MAIQGYKRPLEDKDLWSLNKEDRSDVIVPKLLHEWEKQKLKVKSKQEVFYTKCPTAYNITDEEPHEAEVLFPSKGDQKKPSFLIALCRTFGPYFLSLVITNSAKRSSTVGEIVNLMSVDAQRFMDLTGFLNMLWSAPLQICLALYFLWQYLGPSVLAGVAVMILLIPFNAVIAMKSRSFQ
eukprot:g40549.t1